MASSLLSKGLAEFLSPWRMQVQTVRFRNRINIQRPRPPHFERARMLEACKPKLPPKPAYVCLKSVEKRSKNVVENPFEDILAREARNWFDHSNFVGFIHMCPIKADEKSKVYIQLKREGVMLRDYGRSVMTKALTGHPYEPALSLFISRQSGIVEGRLMSRAQLERFAALPDLTTARAQLVSILAGAAGPAAQLVSHLNTHQRTLVSHLEQRAQQLNLDTTEQT
ncbi:hypothetical protein B566_EDAN009018 [Ephemera danica]|nr:hypothetical protein B566_EDAN009018 [Ephemera danica]